MKKTLLLTTALFAFLFSYNTVQAQIENLNLGGGIELGPAIGDVSDIVSVAIGGRVHALYGFTDNIYGEGAIAFHSLATKDSNTSSGFGGNSDIKTSFRLASIQAGARYYLDPEPQGLFFNASLGIHPLTVKVDYPEELENNAFFPLRDFKETDTEFGLSLGAGYTMGALEGLVRLQTISDLDGSLFLIGLNYRFM